MYSAIISAACGTKVRECGTPTASACMKMCSYTCMFIVPPFQSAVFHSVVLFIKFYLYMFGAFVPLKNERQFLIG